MLHYGMIATGNHVIFRFAALCNTLEGERAERCQWQKKRGERVAAVEKIEEKRKPEDFFGHRNRKPWALPRRCNGTVE